MADEHYSLVENPFYEWELSRLGEIREFDDVLMQAMWAIARLADDLPFAPGSHSIRHITWEPVLRDDGTLIRFIIYFSIADTDTVELLSIKTEEI